MIFLFKDRRIWAQPDSIRATQTMWKYKYKMRYAQWNGFFSDTVHRITDTQIKRSLLIRVSQWEVNIELEQHKEINCIKIWRVCNASLPSLVQYLLIRDRGGTRAKKKSSGTHVILHHSFLWMFLMSSWIEELTVCRQWRFSIIHTTNSHNDNNNNSEPHSYTQAAPVWIFMYHI